MVHGRSRGGDAPHRPWTTPANSVQWRAPTGAPLLRPATAGFAQWAAGREDPGVPDYPASLAPAHQVEPVPRRVRAVAGGRTVFDTTAALYVWEWVNYPQFYIPLADVAPGFLVAEGTRQHSPRGEVETHGLRIGDLHRRRAAKVLASSPVPGLSGTVRFDWGALDAWFEEDEQIFVHPRNPYVRVDALRSTRTLRVELEGVVLAETSSPVMVFETGLPTRYYINRTEVDFDQLIPTATETSCPYKGTTSQYWSVRTPSGVQPDLAWAYDFPTRELLAITGMVAFYNERVDIDLDGRRLERPVTHFFRASP